MENTNARMKLEQLAAILSAATGGNGVDHMTSGEIQALLSACYGLAVDALAAG